MSARRNHRAATISFECDECGTDFEANTEDFHDAIAEFKDAGGTVRLEDGAWAHYCEDCA